MIQLLKQSTAATIKVGPFLATDGWLYEPQTGLTIAQADVRLSKNGGDFAQKNEATSATHDENGYYDIPLDTTDTGTLGRLKMGVYVTNANSVTMEFVVVPANVYDSLVLGTAELIVDVPTATENADALLNRDMSAVSDTNARSPLNAFRFLRNKKTASAGSISVKKEDDSTEAWAATYTTNADAQPITEIDPS